MLWPLVGPLLWGCPAASTLSSCQAGRVAAVQTSQTLQLYRSISINRRTSACAAVLYLSMMKRAMDVVSNAVMDFEPPGCLYFGT
jgi:hypothetical protein